MGHDVHLITALTVMDFLSLWGLSAVIAEDVLIEEFENQPETRWRRIADTVMGEVSTGQAEFVREGGDRHAHMTGSVSAENNDGFIQIRTESSTP